MGIKSLMPFLKKQGLSEQALRPVTTTVFFDRTVGLDVAILLYQALATSDAPGAHLQLLANRAAFFERLGARPVFVFDGAHPVEKKEEEAKRRERREATEARLGEARGRLEARPFDPELRAEVERLQRQCIRVTGRHIEEAEAFLRGLGLPVVRAPGEAERCLAALQAAGKVDLAVSEDTDTLVSGARSWVRCFGNLSNGSLPPLERTACEVRLERVLGELGLSYDGFVNFAALCGSDFAAKLPKVGPVLAFKLAKEVDAQGGGSDVWALSPDSMERCVRAALRQKAVAAALASAADDGLTPDQWVDRYRRAKALLAHDPDESLPEVPGRAEPDDRALWPLLLRYADLTVPPELRDGTTHPPAPKRPRPAPVEVPGQPTPPLQGPLTEPKRAEAPSPQGTV